MARLKSFLSSTYSHFCTSSERDSRTRESVSPWEIPLDRDLASHLASQGGCPAAYIPQRWDSVPELARDALSELVSFTRPTGLAVAPGGVRHVGGAQVYCPTQVLAAGDRGVALWVDDLPFDRVTGALAYRDVRMVEHNTNSESGHLTVIGATHRFTFHYRRPSQPSHEPQLEGLALRIRLRAAGLSEHVMHYGDIDGWRAVELIEESGWPMWQARAGSPRTVILTDHEFVLIDKCSAQFGYENSEDVLAVPRRHLRRIRAARTRLVVDADVQMSVPVGAFFARRVANRIGNDVREPRSPAQHSTAPHRRSASPTATARRRASRPTLQGGPQ